MTIDRADGRMDLTMKVEGMTCGGCAAAVTKAIRRLDPEAEVSVDLERGQVAVVTGPRPSTSPRPWSAPATMPRR